MKGNPVIVLAIGLSVLTLAIISAYGSFSPQLNNTNSDVLIHSRSTNTGPSEATSDSASQSTSVITPSSTSTTSQATKGLLRVEARLPNGTEVRGLRANVASQGITVNSSAVPAAFFLPLGTAYFISLSGEEGVSFAGWSTGQATRSANVSLSEDTVLVANYRPFGLQTVSVVGKLLNGKSVAGVVVDIYQGGSRVENDTLPANFTARYGETYTVVAHGATSLGFRNWNSNATLSSDSYQLKVEGNTTVTAYYKELPVPIAPHGKGNYTVTVFAHTMDGGDLVGAYFQIRIDGVWNHYASGYTPASVSVPAGNEKIVMYHCAQVPGYCSDKYFVYRYYNDSVHTLTRWKFIDLEANTVVNSFYDIIPANDAVHVTVQALNSTGPIYTNCTCGGLITISHDGTPIAQSLEPYAFWLWKGQAYEISVGDIPGYAFVDWNTGGTSHAINIVAEPQVPGTVDQFFAAIYAKQ